MCIALLGSVSVGRLSRVQQRVRPQMQAWTEPEFGAVKIREVRKSTGAGLFEIVAEVPDAYIAAYTTPGQYIQMRPSADVKAGFFAIASPPRADGSLEFLIKATDSTAWLTGAVAGSAVQMCAPAGKGYGVSMLGDPDVDVSNVVFAAAGSGIAPIRALIEADGADGKSLIGLGGARTGQLFYGVQSDELMAFADRFEAWRKRGVEIVPVRSRAPGASGATGYVQDSLPSLLRAPAQSCVVLCGGKEMQIAVKETAAKLGVKEGYVLTNF
jgi:NAD(P)H-flavin reductase